MPSYLVVGNQTLDSPDLAEAIRERVAKEPSTFHVVVPATPIGGGRRLVHKAKRLEPRQRFRDGRRGEVHVERQPRDRQRLAEIEMHEHLCVTRRQVRGV